MGSNIYFPPQRPVLKLSRSSASDRVVIKTEAANRADVPPAADPPPDLTVDEGWRRLHRARELLAAEQAQLMDERNKLLARETDVKLREDTVAERERRVAEREQLVAAAMPPPSKPDDSDSAESAVARFTRAPMEIARAVLRKK